MKDSRLMPLLTGALLTAAAFWAGSLLGGNDARAQNAPGGTATMYAVTNTGSQGQGKDYLFLVDGESTRLAVYELNGGRLSMVAVRNLEFDLQYQEWSPRGRAQVPSVEDVREDIQGG
jgi:hypothetical protein